MEAPDPLIVPWQGQPLRIRHDDPHLGPYTHAGQVIRAAVKLASDVDGLRLVLGSAVGDRYRVKVSDEGRVVGPWRRWSWWWSGSGLIRTAATLRHKKRPAPRGTGLLICDARGG